MDDEELIDRHHLDVQTFGDRDLAKELLGLFAGQCRDLMPGIADPARSAAERADLAHTLKGSALGVGTARVASRAARVEDALRADDPGVPAHVRSLAEAVEATLAALSARH